MGEFCRCSEIRKPERPEMPYTGRSRYCFFGTNGKYAYRTKQKLFWDGKQAFTDDAINKNI